MLAKTALIRSAAFNLALFAQSVRLNNAVALTDESVGSEDFLKDLLNLIYDFKLVNLNIESLNYPSADLGDDEKQLCIQVTADSSGEKIQNAIDKFNKHNLNKKYNRLIIVIVGDKRKYTRIFDSQGLKFDPNSDVWDIKDLVRKVRTLETDALRSLDDFFTRELMDKISINATPIQLNEEDMRELIHLIYLHIKIRGAGATLSGRKYEIGQRDDDFIEKKNKLNEVSDTFFTAEIRHSLIHQKEIETFLKDPINAKSLAEYFEATEAIQKTARENSEKFSEIEDVFQEVYRDVVIEYENRNLEKRKILVILHNMYFNCDIGTNP